MFLLLSRGGETRSASGFFGLLLFTSLVAYKGTIVVRLLFSLPCQGCPKGTCEALDNGIKDIIADGRSALLVDRPNGYYFLRAEARRPTTASFRSPGGAGGVRMRPPKADA